MASPPPSLFSLFFLLSVLAVAVAAAAAAASAAASAAFTPTDHYLINCGSHDPITADIFNRRFISDSPESRNSLVHLSSTRTIQLTDPNPSPTSSPIYHTARAFTRPSKYTFTIRDRGTHLVRLHFRKFDIDCDFSDAQFHVLANEYVLLHNFDAEKIGNTEMIKDYMIWVDSDELEITFVPLGKSKIAFVNAIEVISAPKDLVADVAQYVSNDQNFQISGLLKNGYEVMHRINVGGPKVTPFNDSLWRTWVTDDEFLKSTDGSSRMFFSGRIRYQMGGASREVGPDNVYSTARLIKSVDGKVPDSKIMLEFPVVGGYKYLVRMHFCDIASVSLGLLYFNVYVNGNLAYENLDLTTITSGMLASPFYADFVVDGESSGALSVSVAPSNMSVPRAVDAILNGVEIMKINNSMGSFDGEFCMQSLFKNWRKTNVGFVVPSVAAMFLLLVAYVVLQRRNAQSRDSVAWSPLPIDAAGEANLKFESGKV